MTNQDILVFGHYAILFAQILDDMLLLLIHPARHRKE
jgi:hypothetical protein